MSDLRAVARRRTADADTVLDENGKPVAATGTDLAAGPRPGRPVPAAPHSGRPVAADVSSAEPDDLTADDSTVIVPENETLDVPDDLFGENGNGNSSGRRRKKRRKRRK